VETLETRSRSSRGHLHLTYLVERGLKRYRAIGLAAGVAAPALASSGCAGSFSTSGVAYVGTATPTAPAGTAAGSGQGAGASERLLRYAQCIRAHGVSNLPDPSSGGTLAISKSIVTSPKYASASQACKSLAPAGTARAADSELQKQLLAFARCMREHGVANFADPNGSGAFALPSSVKNSPRYDAAQRACRSLEPGGGD
jgi:hypothetical protein